MNFTHISNQEVLNRLKKLAHTERKITHLILWHLVEVENRKLHLELGYASLFKYLTMHLKYSEDAAYRRMQAAKLFKKVPTVEKALETGELNLTQLQQVQKCLNLESQNGKIVSVEQTESILVQIQNKSSFETQKVLAVEFNLPAQQYESLKPQQNDSTRLEMTLTAEQMRQLQKAKELLSHVLPNPSWAELIGYLAQAQIQKRLGKSETVVSEMTAKTTDIPTKRKSVRKHIKLSVKRMLLQKCNHTCEYSHPIAGRCHSKYQLQIDHRVPLALGGTDEISNLRVLCRQHNLAEARHAHLPGPPIPSR
ncbi:HNH endonuclease [Bdellovibrio sp. HCB288]|uniref:HNH endonuclease n=1 Tax=Bdellovibrio sp. HCB288 TaxID=3394355 RepID=UPI0039B39A2C